MDVVYVLRPLLVPLATMGCTLPTQEHASLALRELPHAPSQPYKPVRIAISCLDKSVQGALPTAKHALISSLVPLAVSHTTWGQEALLALLALPTVESVPVGPPALNATLAILKVLADALLSVVPQLVHSACLVPIINALAANQELTFKVVIAAKEPLCSVYKLQAHTIQIA